MKQKPSRKTKSAHRRSVQPDGWAASKDLALANWMQDVTSLLCYQPEVPHAHKESLVKALDRYTHCSAQLAAGEPPNVSDQATAGKKPQPIEGEKA